MTLKYRLLFAAVSFAIVAAFSVMIAMPGCSPAPESAPPTKPAVDKKAADEKAAADKKAADEKAAKDKAEADKKAADEKATKEKAEADKKAAEEKAAKEKAEADKKAADEKAAKDKAEADKKAADEKAAKEKAEADKKAAEAKKPADKPADKPAAGATGMPATPKVSTFAPAADLVAQADDYLKSLEEATADEAAYKEGADKVAKDSNTLIVIALALGLSDQDSKYKANAGAMMKAAQAVAATKDLAGAKKAVADLKVAAEGKAKADVTLKWEKVASLAELMKQVPIINTKLKRSLKKFEKKADDSAGYSAVLAVIAQGAMPDTSPAKNPEQVKQWYDWSVKARDYAGALNAAVHSKNEAAANEAMEKMAKNCDDCHAVFHPGT